MAARRRSRARVRMISSSRCTVAAATGASTHWPFWLHLPGGGDAQRVGAQVAVEDGRGHLDALGRVLRVRIPFGDDHAAVGIALRQRREGKRVERGAPEIGVDADLGDLARGLIDPAGLVLGRLAQGAVDVVLDPLAAGERDGASGGENESAYASHAGVLGNGRGLSSL